MDALDLARAECIRRGCPELADDIALVEFTDDPVPAVMRPARALTPHEALTMLHAWDVVYRAFEVDVYDPSILDDERSVAERLALLVKPVWGAR